MNYLHTLHTFLEHHFTPTICCAGNSCDRTHTVPITQLKALLAGLSDNQFENLICYLIEEGHILHATVDVVTFCPMFIATLYPPGASPRPSPKEREVNFTTH